MEYTSSHSVEPNVQVTDIQWQLTQEEINFKPKVVDTLTYINGSSYPVDKMFGFSWSSEEVQKTTWSQHWSIGENFEYKARLPGLDYTVNISYDHMCSTLTTLVLWSSKKSLQVTVAPRKTIIAHLVLLASEVTEFPFIATIKSVGANKRGILYKPSSSKINVHETELGIM